jgi:hypothetical protein
VPSFVKQKVSSSSGLFCLTNLSLVESKMANDFFKTSDLNIRVSI